MPGRSKDLVKLYECGTRGLVDVLGVDKMYVSSRIGDVFEEGRVIHDF